jgi:hypothetical protein
MLIAANLASDNIYTHLFSSFLAASGATVITQPMDVSITSHIFASIPSKSAFAPFSGAEDADDERNSWPIQGPS